MRRLLGTFAWACGFSLSLMNATSFFLSHCWLALLSPVQMELATALRTYSYCQQFPPPEPSGNSWGWLWTGECYLGPPSGIQSQELSTTGLRFSFSWSPWRSSIAGARSWATSCGPCTALKWFLACSWGFKDLCTSFRIGSLMLNCLAVALALVLCNCWCSWTCWMSAVVFAVKPDRSLDLS